MRCCASQYALAIYRPSLSARWIRWGVSRLRCESHASSAGENAEICEIGLLTAPGALWSFGKASTESGALLEEATCQESSSADSSR